MADNVAITAGSGTSVAADDIGSVFYQRTKLSLGADGTAADYQGYGKLAYASAVDFTCTMASKTSGQGRRSAVVDNSSNLYTQAAVFVSLTPGTITAPAGFAVYLYGSFDASNYYSGGSTDADYNTLAGDEIPLGFCAILANSTARGQWFVTPQGIALPKSWGIIISQTNCGTLSGTEGNHLKKYVGLNPRAI